MLVSQYVNFSEVNFDKTELPEYIISIKKEYNEALKKNNYILEQSQYDEYTAKWARVHDWLSIQFARAKYLKKTLEVELDWAKSKGKELAPSECKSDLAKRKWVESNDENYYKIAKNMALAEGYYTFFEREIESAKMYHYLCKGMSQSIDSDKGIGG